MDDGKPQTQVDRFIAAAKALGADEDEAAFRAKLAVIARQRPKVAPDASPFNEGADAHRAGRDVSDNPYEEGQPEQHEWAQGWHAAEARSRG